MDAYRCDPLKGEGIRSSHRYESSPDSTLFKRLGKASMETIGQLGEHVMAQKHLFRKVDNITVNGIANFLLVSNSDISYAGSTLCQVLTEKAHRFSQSTCELSEILSQQMFGRGVQSCSNAFWDQGLLLLLMVSLMENHPPIFVTNYLQKVQALQLYKIDVGTVVLEIINTNIGDHLSPTVDGRSLMLLPISKPMNLSHVEMTF
ncbi:hypothetical protein L195_g014956 [Trifolium pratense]|uniref:Uncharacterized protein n=1 Tax=Trifolium pratense TaxID=57577 RepID=A0A2K3MLY0_TRIPR|nr:hypothetical protein L195_g014956 [Trifolium pratense]